MRRDMDEVRRILKSVSDSPKKTVDISLLTDDTHPLDNVAFQVQLMEEAGFIHADVRQTFDGTTLGTVGPITWKGSDFLEKVRDDGIWRRVKQVLARTVGSTSVAVIGKLAESLALKAIGLSGER